MKKLFILLTFTMLWSIAVAQPTISKEERKISIQYLENTMLRLKKLTKELSEAQLNYKSAPDRWSIRDNIEHLINVEGVVWEIIHKTLQSESVANGKSDITDEAISAKLAIRSETTPRFKAPESLQPSGKYKDFQETFAAFVNEREKTIQFVKKTKEDLRHHFSSNPVLGNLDTYQWTLFISAHTVRHTLQVEEILADVNFPKL